jgi:thioredoxin 2
MSDAPHIVCPHCGAVNQVPASKPAAAARCGKCRGSLFAGPPAELSEAAFRRHLERDDIPLLVDFWAPWCGPCRMMAPAYEQAARQLEPDVRVAKVNTEEAQTLAAQLGIRSIPTLALFGGGRELARTAGAMDAGSIVAWVRQHLRG